MRDFSAAVEISTVDGGVTIEAGGTPLAFASRAEAVATPPSPDADSLERLVHAAVRRWSLRMSGGAALPPGLDVFCATSIPRQVGFAGSSAAIIATMRALDALAGLSRPPHELAEEALLTETEDLGIAAGPLDRIVQSYGRTMLVDLAPPRDPARYLPLDPALVPPLLLAWTAREGAPSGVTHSDLRRRFDRGDAEVRAAMAAYPHLVDHGVAALERGDHEAFADLVDENFALRRSIVTVGEDDLRMVGIATGLGAAAKLPGSGGAVLVVGRAGVDLREVAAALDGAGFRTCRPMLA